MHQFLLYRQGIVTKNIIQQRIRNSYTGYLMAGVLAIGITTGLLAGADQVWGQGPGAITVLGTRHETDFPRQITIKVTVEGEHEIVEVKSNYRPVGSQVWAYEYSDFDS